jgi:hypothetical protein
MAELAAAAGVDPWFIDQVKGMEEHTERMVRGWLWGRRAGPAAASARLC